MAYVRHLSSECGASCWRTWTTQRAWLDMRALEDGMMWVRLT